MRTKERARADRAAGPGSPAGPAEARRRRPPRRGHLRPKLRRPPAAHPHTATRQLTGVPRNSSSGARRRRARTAAGRRGPARPPPSACSGPGPVAPRAAVQSSSRAGRRAGARASLPALPSALLLRAAGQQIPISAASAAEDARSRGEGRRVGEGRPRRARGAGARALGRARQLCAHPPRGAGPAPDTNRAESSAEVPEGPVEFGAPLPGRRTGRRHGGARLPREGGPPFSARRRHTRDGGAAGARLREVDGAGTPLLEPELALHVRSCRVAPKAPSLHGAGSVARFVVVVAKKNVATLYSLLTPSRAPRPGSLRFWLAGWNVEVHAFSGSRSKSLVSARRPGRWGCCAPRAREFLGRKIRSGGRRLN